MLGFGPIAGTGTTISGALQWINPLAPTPGSLTSDRWQLARLVGFRSSYSNVSGRPLYRPELCNSSKSLVSSKYLANARYLGSREGRALYKANASYFYHPSLAIPPAPSSAYTYGRLIGSRSSFTSNSSMISGRPLYAARGNCPENKTPSSFSSSSSPRSYSYRNVPTSEISGGPPGCCPTKTEWPYRLVVHVQRTTGDCMIMDGIDGAEMVWGYRSYWAAGPGTCNPSGWGWWGSIFLPDSPIPPYASPGIPFLLCQNSGFNCRLYFQWVWGNYAPSSGIGSPYCIYSGFGGPGGGTFSYEWDAPSPFGPGVCNGVFPLTGTAYMNSGPATMPCCPYYYQSTTWNFQIEAAPEP